ncbi:ethanolamine ammonia-lyase subunit EutC [Zhongshania guokunii]|uniref:Ethanolamine ammonia-lyase small subunit n=1 Tax=Zhongshania guokunii TaxID=641783 RepID=A0ABV3U437_9GAMM
MDSSASDHWSALREYTSARIALGRAGVATNTSVNLRFQLDHAKARDAVLQALDVNTLADDCATMLANSNGDQHKQLFPAMQLCSLAEDRHCYLQRPDLGRQLPETQWQALAEHAATRAPIDVALIIGDGLSSVAISTHAAPVLAALTSGLAELGLQLGPLCIARQARVALADDIGEALGAKLTVILIGERPGLSSPDSLGLYITHSPKRGRSDAERNCISNIRGAGMSYQHAVNTALYLIRNALAKGYSGINLKDDSATLSTDVIGVPFLK